MSTIAIRNGQVQFIADDELNDLRDSLGTHRTKRVSDVEPDDNGNWVADMNKMGEDVQFGPYANRKDALAAEVEFVTTRLGEIK